MPVLAFELRRQLPGCLVACVIAAVLVAALLGGLYPVFHDAQNEVERILASYPPQFLEAFGVHADILTFPGFLSFSAFYLEIVAAVGGFSWGLGAFGRERRDRCADFLLTRPCPRASLFAQKLGACLVSAALLTIAFAASAVVAVRWGGLDVDAARLAGACAAMGGVCLVFTAAGALVGVLAPRVRSVSGWASSAGAVGFVLAVLPSIADDDKLRVISPFWWFSPAQVMKDGALSGEYLPVAVACTVGLLLTSFFAYTRLDARSA